MDANYKPDKPFPQTITEGMADVTYMHKRLSGHDFKSARPVAIKLNVGVAAGRALVWCGTNHNPHK